MAAKLYAHSTCWAMGSSPNIGVVRPLHQSQNGLGAALAWRIGRLFAARAYSSCSQRAISPPMTPPTIGATQNSQSDPSAAPPPKMAVAVERAGFTDALSTGMATRWMKVSVNPMAIGAKPTGAFGNV